MSSEIEPKPGSVTFLQFHQPTLAAGDYKITVEQAVKVDKTDVRPFSETKLFTVAGERFELNPIDVLGVFPPEGNLGEHSNVLPHIILSRSTLPWERFAEVRSGAATQTPAAGNTNIPWLALLLFDGDHNPKPKTVKVADLKETGTKFPDITLEIGQRLEDLVTVIDVPQSLLEDIMPAAEELKLLAHVRLGLDTAGKPLGEELAIIIANRLPQKGKTSTVHLVSVEGRFREVGGKYVFDYQSDVAGDLIRLVSLKSWSFACEDEKKDFKELLLALNATPTTLRLPEGAPSAEQLLARGYVLLPHYYREGDEIASWYHGPLVPGKVSSPLLPGDNETSQFVLPARSADELVRYDTALSMFDVTYAAAWELGRLLALQDKDFSTGLYQWKREYAQQRARKKQREENPDVPYQSAMDVLVPETIFAWFKRLRGLEGVPFNYLVPDERMLPAESIRFFHVDRAWLDCLADGAFSIGRVSSSDYEADGSHGLKSPAVGLSPMLTGFLLRSEVVSGWPGLLVDGYADDGGNKPVRMHRMDRLSKGVLLCIFWGEIRRVDLHLKAETLHFGLSRSGDGFAKQPRDLKGVPLKNQVKLQAAHWRKQSSRTLSVVELAELVRKQLTNPPPLSSALFALQMVEGVDNIVFAAK